MDEVKFVQPRSFELLQTLIETYFPDMWSQKLFMVYNKVDSTKIFYSTSLTMGEDSVPIEGYTDASLYYCDVLVLSWEDKNLNSTLTHPSERGQILAETKAGREAFYLSLGVHPPKYVTIQTSGIVWSMTYSRYTPLGSSLFSVQPISAQQSMHGVVDILCFALKAVDALVKIVDKAVLTSISKEVELPLDKLQIDADPSDSEETEEESLVETKEAADSGRGGRGGGAGGRGAGGVGQHRGGRGGGAGGRGGGAGGRGGVGQGRGGGGGTAGGGGAGGRGTGERGAKGKRGKVVVTSEGVVAKRKPLHYLSLTFQNIGRHNLQQWIH